MRFYHFPSILLANGILLYGLPAKVNDSMLMRHIYYVYQVHGDGDIFFILNNGKQLNLINIIITNLNHFSQNLFHETEKRAVALFSGEM